MERDCFLDDYLNNKHPERGCRVPTSKASLWVAVVFGPHEGGALEHFGGAGKEPPFPGIFHSNDRPEKQYMMILLLIPGAAPVRRLTVHHRRGLHRVELPPRSLLRIGLLCPPFVR